MFRTAAANITASISICPCATWCKTVQKRIHLVDGMLATADHRARRPERFGALGFQFVSADAAHAWCTPITTHQTAEETRDYEINPNMGWCRSSCARGPTRSRARADGATFFQFALRYYGQGQNRARPAPGTVNMWDEYNKWKRRIRSAGSGIARRPDRLAGNHRQEIATLRTSHIDQ